ncbi:MAG: histone H1 [Bacteroidetes bacterium]|nr:histone H1 [Bacteroidota bacterium]
MKKVVEDLHQLFDDFKVDAILQLEKANKAAGTRARKTSLAIEKALKDYRKKSIEASKK